MKKLLVLFLLLVPQISYGVGERFKSFFKKSLYRGSQGIGLLIGAAPAWDTYANNEAAKLALQNVPEHEMVTDKQTLDFVHERLLKHGIQPENVTVLKTFSIPGQMAMYSIDKKKAVLFLNVDPRSRGFKTELEIFLKEGKRNMSPIDYQREKAQIESIVDHEAGHHLKNHTSKKVIAKGGFTVGFQGISAIANNALALRSLPAKMAFAMGRGIAVALATEVADKGYSRVCEREADENVLDNIDNRLAFADYFDSFAQIPDNKTFLEKIMSTHPEDKERAGTAYIRVAQSAQRGNKSTFPPLTLEEKKTKGELWFGTLDQYQRTYDLLKSQQ